MKLLECIAKLKEIHESAGDVRVKVRNSEGEWDDIEGIANISFGTFDKPDLIVYIDTYI